MQLRPGAKRKVMWISQSRLQLGKVVEDLPRPPLYHERYGVGIGLRMPVPEEVVSRQ